VRAYWRGACSGTKNGLGFEKLNQEIQIDSFDATATVDANGVSTVLPYSLTLTPQKPKNLPCGSAVNGNTTIPLTSESGGFVAIEATATNAAGLQTKDSWA